MKNLKKHVIKWYVVAPIILVFIAIACEQEAGPEVQDFTGEEMFRGVFFQQGEVASMLGMVNESLSDLVAAGQVKEEFSATYLEFTDEIVIQINLLDPEYFDDFKNQIVSDNYYAIELALISGQDMIQAAGLKSNRYTEMFQLLIELQDRNITFDQLVGDLDLSSSEDAASLKNTIKEEYGFILDDASFGLLSLAYYWPCNKNDYACKSYWKEKFKSVLFPTTDNIGYAADNLVGRLADLF